MFTLLTGRAVADARKPGESVEGTAAVYDPRVERLSEICRPQKTTYAENCFLLCPDASLSGESREWLDSARRCDLICLMVRAFEDEGVYHPQGSIDPVRDMQALEAELLLADMEVVEKRLVRIAKEMRAKRGAEQETEEKALRKCMDAMEAGTRLADAGLEPHELRVILSLGLLTLIPVLGVYNVSEEDAAKESGPQSLTVSALIEKEIMAIENDRERGEYLASIGLQSSGLVRMNAAAYDALGLMSFYTVGEDEVRAWSIVKGSMAPKAGGKIHSDIERGFIRVEVIKYDDLVAAGSEKACRDAGRLQTRGKDYTLEDGDICHFLFNV